MFAAVTLRDITFVTDGNVKYYDNVEGAINFDKMRLLCRAVYALNFYDHQPFDYSAVLEEDRTVQNAIAHVCHRGCNPRLATDTD
jgi:hypothetical protein